MKQIQTKTQKKIDQIAKQQEIDINYLKKMADLNLKSMILEIKMNYVEELFNKKILSSMVFKKLIDELKENDKKISKKQSDITIEAFSEGVSKKDFTKYILS